MGTLFSIIFLWVIAIIAFFLAQFILNIAGLPGALMVLKFKKYNKKVYFLGSLISAMGQSYIYLAYVAFVVSWTFNIIQNKNVGSIIWFFAFFAVVLPLGVNLRIAEREAVEDGYVTNPQIKGLAITLAISVIGFFIFIFNANLMRNTYGWVLDII